MRKIIAEEGAAGLKTGWVPTLFGYGFQGLFKFGLNEFFKDYYGNLIGQENLTTTARKMALWAAASGSAEIFADIALCPFEMTKVKMQVSLPGHGKAFPRSMGPALNEMWAGRATTGFPFGSLGPLWGRQGEKYEVFFGGGEWSFLSSNSICVFFFVLVLGMGGRERRGSSDLFLNTHPCLNPRSALHHDQVRWLLPHC